ncbi:MAG: Calx-beta domain-containing protein, partial [Verrucomicrobiota bacterium]
AANSGGRITGSGSLSTLPGTSIASLRVAAPTTGISSATFTVVLSVASETPVSLHYATVDGSALAGTDYTSTSGTLVFAAGETSKTVNVPILANPVAQPDKTFSLGLSAASGAILTQSSALCTIITSSLAPPSNPLATVTGTSGIKLTWSAPPFVPDGYILQRSSNGGAYVTLATLPAGTHSYLDTTVQGGITYSYRLASYNSVVTSANSTAVATTWSAGANTFPPLAFSSARDYGAMWWRGGVRGERVWQIKTSRYAMSFDCDALNLTTIFPLSAYLPETAALVQPNDQSFPASAPVSSLACSLTASGTQYAIQTASINRADAQLVDSGKFFQRRWQKVKTTSGPALDPVQSGLEICAWPDRVSITCRVIPTVDVPAGQMDLTLSFQNIYHILSSSGLAQAFGATDGSGYVVLKSSGATTLTTDAANTRVSVSTTGGTWLANEERSVGLVIYPAMNIANTFAAANAIEGGQLTVTASQVAPSSAVLTPAYDLDRGYFEVPLRSDATDSDANRI